MGHTPQTGINSWLAGKQRCNTSRHTELLAVRPRWIDADGEIDVERDSDDTVYCDIQMPVAQGRELLALVNALRESKAHPSLDRVFEHMQDELSTSIDIVENPPTWGPWCQ